MMPRAFWETIFMDGFRLVENRLVGLIGSQSSRHICVMSRVTTRAAAGDHEPPRIDVRYRTELSIPRGTRRKATASPSMVAGRRNHKPLVQGSSPNQGSHF